jgi:hypothetical protein
MIRSIQAAGIAASCLALAVAVAVAGAMILDRFLPATATNRLRTDASSRRQENQNKHRSEFYVFADNIRNHYEVFVSFGQEEWI